MEKNIYYLRCICHDAILSEYIEDGIKITHFPLNAQHKDQALVEARGLLERLLESAPVDCDNKKARKRLKDETFRDWGHKEPYLVFNDKEWPLI